MLAALNKAGYRQPEHRVSDVTAACSHTPLNRHTPKIKQVHFMQSSTSNQNKQRYLVLIKLNTSKTEPFYNALMQITENPSEGVRMNAAYNVFGEWDFAVWFQADNNDSAVHFVGEKIRAIEGVTETVTMPATPVKEYQM
jgi:uncharacterized protein with GYD domain